MTGEDRPREFRGHLLVLIYYITETWVRNFKKWPYFRDVFRNGLLKQENEIFSVDRETSNLGYNIFHFLI